MPWVNGHIRVCHPREPWLENLPPIIVQNGLFALKGKKGSDQLAEYWAAKRKLDFEAAKKVILRTITPEGYRALVSHTMTLGLDAKIVVPHPSFDDDDADARSTALTASLPTNALPFAYATYISEITGCPVDEEIVQTSRPGRTKLSKMARFLYQPSFGGAVQPGQTYILADDVVTTGGTLAALVSYIHRNHGQVVFATALANFRAGNQRFAIKNQTVNTISTLCGPRFNEFWTETIGHDIHCLTEAEGLALVEWSNEQITEGCTAGDQLLERLRDRLDEAATKCG